MKQQLLLLSVTLGLFYINIEANGQKGNYALLQPGDSFPQYTFNEIRHFKKSKADLDDFRGKWLVLSFWNRHCLNCIKKMPQEDSLQQEFADSVQFLLVGYTGSQYSRIKGPDYDRTQELYERIRERMGLSLPVAYDSTLFHKMDITACPYLIIVDPFGDIQGITISLSAKELKALMAGQRPTLERAYRRWEHQRLQKTTARNER